MPWVDSKELSEQKPPSKKEAQEVLTYLARRAKPRFYADENFPSEAVRILRAMGAKVLTVHETRKTRHPDENHAAYALRNGLVLLSCDRDFLDDKRFPLIHCPAIFVFNFGDGSAREIWRAFRCLATVFTAPQFFDKWCKVDAGRDSWVESMRYQNGTTSRGRFRLWRGQIQEWLDERNG
jgi:predicted nuclease of predicted toxin-antitoxin system